MSEEKETSEKMQIQAIDSSLLITVLNELRVLESSLIRTSLKEAGPEFPKMQSYPKIAIDPPKTGKISQALISKSITVTDLARKLKLSRRELYASIGYSGYSLRSRLFDRLEKLAQNRSEIGPLIKTIRERYE